MTADTHHPHSAEPRSDGGEKSPVAPCGASSGELLESTVVSRRAAYTAPEEEAERLRLAHERASEVLAGWRPYSPLPKDVSPNLVPGCTLQAVLGVGGMGVVYLARQKTLGREVAVKVLTPELANDRNFLERLQREAQIMGTLTHPNLVGCHDIIISKNGAALLMEYVPGHLNGRDVVRLLGPMPNRYATQVILAVARALNYAYEKGFTHRDVKPDNILFGFSADHAPRSYQELFEAPDFRIALCDFGIASTKSHIAKSPSVEAVLVSETRNVPDDMADSLSAGKTVLSGDGSSTSSGAVVGSPLYMSPEQALAPEVLDCRSDIYSLGATAFFLLTGHPPFTGQTMEEVLELKTQCDIPFPSVRAPLPAIDGSLARTVAKMGCCHPEDRYQNYAKLLERLEALEVAHASKLTFRIFTHRYRRLLRRVGLGALACGFLVLLGVYGYIWQMEHYEERLMISTAALGNWSGAINTWRQTFEAGSTTLVGGTTSGAITLREVLQQEDRLLISVSLRDIGATTLLLHEDGHPEQIYAKITCYREEIGNVVRLYSPKELLSGGQFGEVPSPPVLPDLLSEWVRLRLEIGNGYCLVWNQNQPIGVCHFPVQPGDVRARLTIAKVNCPAACFGNIAHIRQ